MTDEGCHRDSARSCAPPYTHSRREFQSHNPGDDQRHTGEAQRRNRLQDDVEREAQTFEQFDDRSSFDAVAQGETGKLVREAIGKLSKDQREAIELAFFSSMTQTEIAARLKVPLGTVKARIRRGMMRMREVISPEL